MLKCAPNIATQCQRSATLSMWCNYFNSTPWWGYHIMQSKHYLLDVNTYIKPVKKFRTSYFLQLFYCQFLNHIQNSPKSGTKCSFSNLQQTSYIFLSGWQFLFNKTCIFFLLPKRCMNWGWNFTTKNKACKTNFTKQDVFKFI